MSNTERSHVGSGRRRSFLLVLSVLLTGATAGCGNASMGDVRGQVTLDGQPVTDVVVRFLPQPKEGGAYAESKAAFGEVDSDGRYRLSTNGEYDGASVGTHRVTVNPLDPSKRPAGALPANMLVKVESGSNEIDLQLEPAARE